MIKIAYVEDEARNHFTFEQYTILLKAHGVENTLAIYTTGEEALQAIPKEIPDIIFMDVRLPGITGLDVTRQLRQQDNLRGLPIIALTAYAMPADRQAALDAGCDDFLAKPVRYQAVEDVIRRYLPIAAGNGQGESTATGDSDAGESAPEKVETVDATPQQAEIPPTRPLTPPKEITPPITPTIPVAEAPGVSSVATASSADIPDPDATHPKKPF